MALSAAKMNAARLVAAAWVLSSFASMYLFKIRVVGLSTYASNGIQLVEAESHPFLVCWSLAGIFLFVMLFCVGGAEVNGGIPSLLRRFAAFLIDFWCSVLVPSSILALLFLYAEARRTGHFVWHFERDHSVPGDDSLFFLTFALVVGFMLLYFVLPLTRGKQTIGCFLMRTKVLPPFGDRGAFTFRQAVRRTWYEVKGLSVLRLFGKDKDRDSQGRIWHDRETNCTVVLIKYQ